MYTASLREPALRPGVLFFAAVVLVGANLRTVFSSLPPLLEDVRADLGLSAAAAGLLTTAPVLCFSAAALAAPVLARRYPIERILAACAALTAVGAGVRGIGTTAALFAGTILAGAAVAVAQTALPTLLRVRFPGHGGSLTGAFSMSLTLGAAIAAGSAVPVARFLDDSWRASLAAFGVPAAIAAALWLVAGSRTTVARSRPLGLRRSGSPWSLPAYFGLQSAAFYCGLTWLPTILEHEGYGEEAGGGLLALTNAIQLAPAMLVPMIAARRRNQRAVLVACALIGAAGLAGLLVAPGAAPLWVVVLGIGQGGSLGLALMLPFLRGANAAAVASLMALSLSAGYLLSATGPTLVGLAHDLSGGWTLPLLLMIGLTLAEVVPGWRAAGAWTVGEADADAVYRAS
jgi:CP family cyanate transporter-like MFS transporter